MQICQEIVKEYPFLMDKNIGSGYVSIKNLYMCL